MKIFKCQNCKRVRHTSNDIKYIQCRCGHAMRQVDEKHYIIKSPTSNK